MKDTATQKQLRELIKMRAYAYNNLVKEYKRRVAMNKAIAVTLKDETITGYYKESAAKKYRINEEIASDLIKEIKGVNKEDIVYA